MITLRKHVLMEGAPGAAGGGAAAAATGEPAAATGTGAHTAGTGAPAAAAAGMPGTGGSSVLAKAGEAAPATDPAKAGQATEIFPDKFKVVKEDGSVDIEASARKMAESYTHLEKRTGAGEAPPKTAEEYVVTVPDEWKDAFPTDSETMAAFRKDAHAQGLSQKQFDFFIGKYIEQAPQLIKGGAQLTFEAADTELRGDWKTQAEYDTQTGNAFKAWKAFADPKDAAKMDEVGNHPSVVRLLARIGAEMREGGSVPNGADATGGEDIKALMLSEANTNPKHPDFKATRAKVDAFYAKKYGTTPVT